MRLSDAAGWTRGDKLVNQEEQPLTFDIEIALIDDQEIWRRRRMKRAAAPKPYTFGIDNKSPK